MKGWGGKERQLSSWILEILFTFSCAFQKNNKGHTRVPQSDLGDRCRRGQRNSQHLKRKTLLLTTNHLPTRKSQSSGFVWLWGSDVGD